MIYKKNGFIGAGLIGADTKLSVLGAFRIVEDAVTEMMAALKIDGLTVERQYNAMWVFTKNRIKLIRPLQWGEDYTVESFITAFSLVRLNIETAVKDKSGEIVAYSKTELCALNLGTGRILKTSEVGLNETFVKEPSLMDVVFTNFSGSELPQVESATVRSTNIDFSHHTNNVEYVRLLLNTYSVKEIIDSPIKEIEVCYISQSFENDVLQIYKLTEGNRDILMIGKENKPIVKCEVLH